MISVNKTLDLKVFIAELRLRRWKGGGGLCDLSGAFGHLANDWLQKNVEDHDWMEMNELNLLVAKS